MREGLRLVLERAGFTIDGMAENAPELVRCARRLRPGLVVADIRMGPDYTDDGLRAVIELRAERPELPVMVISHHVHRRYASELLEAGDTGVGYLLKQRLADVDAFIDDLCRVLHGGTVLDPVVVAAMIERPRPGDPLAALTAHQREVLALIAEGRTNAGIARALDVAETAVARHAAEVYEELGIDRSTDDHRRARAVVRRLSR